MNATELLSSLKWRYAVKTFDPSKKILPETWDALEQALVLTPSSYGLQPWKFLVITDKEIRQRLREASWNQPQVTDCSHYVIFLRKESMDESYIDEYMQSISQIRSISLDTLAGFKKGIVNDVLQGPRKSIQKEWLAHQTYIALGNFMTCAAVLNVDACPMEGLDPIKYNEILQLHDSGYTTVMACAAGYRNPADRLASAKKVRFQKDKLIEHR